MSTAPENRGSQVDYRQKWYVLLVVSIGVFLATLDSSIVNIALPTLARDLQAEFALVQWIVLAYLLTITTLLLSIGRLGDMMGKKRIYTGGFVVFTVGSVLCGLAPTIGWLIGFRVLQALGAAMIFALGPAIITEAFPTSERGRALGLIGIAVSAGIVAGPTLGGVLVSQLSWHWIFFVNLPVGIVGTLMALRYVPDIAPPGGQRFDYPGALTLLLSLLGLTLGLTIGQEIGFDHPLIIGLFGGWLCFLALFLRIEQRSDHPMIDLQIFHNRDFSVGLATGFISFVLIAGVFFLIPFYLESALNYPPWQAGLLLAVVPITLGIVAPCSGWLSDRFGTSLITLVGLGILVLGYGLLTLLSAETTTAQFLLLFLPIGIGMGVFQSPNNSAIIGSAPPEQRGVASGFLAITRTLGQTTGVALLSSVWASRVQASAGSLPPAGAPAAPIASQVAGLHETLLLALALIVLAASLSLWAWQRQLRPGPAASGPN